MQQQTTQICYGQHPGDKYLRRHDRRRRQAWLQRLRRHATTIVGRFS